ILVGSTFWNGLFDWIKSTMLHFGNISPEDLNLIHIVDDKEEVVEIIDAFYKGHILSPNF
ncbi:MAG: TIGR00730 family Rossman fold protein, partial [Flavobacteriales bacterium]